VSVEVLLGHGSVRDFEECFFPRRPGNVRVATSAVRCPNSGPPGAVEGLKRSACLGQSSQLMEREFRERPASLGICTCYIEEASVQNCLYSTSRGLEGPLLMQCHCQHTRCCCEQMDGRSVGVGITACHYLSLSQTKSLPCSTYRQVRGKLS